MRTSGCKEMEPSQPLLLCTGATEKQTARYAREDQCWRTGTLLSPVQLHEVDLSIMVIILSL